MSKRAKEARQEKIERAKRTIMVTVTRTNERKESAAKDIII